MTRVRIPLGSPISLHKAAEPAGCYNQDPMTRTVFFLLVLLFAPAAVRAELPRTETRVIHHDPFGIWQLKKSSRDFQQVTERGAKVVFMPEEQTFFTYYVPPDCRSGRVLISIHGTGGNPYIAMRDELDDAEIYDHAVVALSWFSEERGFFKAEDLYRNILQALEFVRAETGNDLSKVAYVGFSRGAAVSYEVAYLDAKGENLIDLFISHSGGVPTDLRVEAKNPDSKPDPFFSALTAGTLGEGIYRGEKFFLYSGDKDEQWGPKMSLQMENAKNLIEANGGEVLEWVREPEGGHMGFLNSPALKEKAIRYFIRGTQGL